jgi:hypothetical protein
MGDERCVHQLLSCKAGLANSQEEWSGPSRRFSSARIHHKKLNSRQADRTPHTTDYGREAGSSFGGIVPSMRQSTRKLLICFKKSPSGDCMAVSNKLKTEGGKKVCPDILFPAHDKGLPGAVSCRGLCRVEFSVSGRRRQLYRPDAHANWILSTSCGTRLKLDPARQKCRKQRTPFACDLGSSHHRFSVLLAGIFLGD